MPKKVHGGESEGHPLYWVLKTHMEEIITRVWLQKTERP